MKNTTLLGLVAVIVIVVGLFIFTETREVNSGANIISGETQQVTLSMRDLNYYPREIRVKANQPVEVRLDDSVDGCLRAVVFNLGGNKKASKYLATSEDTLVFTPTEKGTFNFACTMNMAYGKMIVE